MTVNDADQPKWVAPFTFHQELALIVWQARMHPYTCPNDGRKLKPSPDGLWCQAPRGCGYLQTWAHPFDPYDSARICPGCDEETWDCRCASGSEPGPTR